MSRRAFFSAVAMAAAALAVSAVTFDAAQAQRGPDNRGYGRGPGPAHPGPGPTAHRPGSWELLGSQTVGFHVDRDIVRVGRKDGRFRAIRLRVRNNAIQLLDLKVVYGNGQVDDIPVRQKLRAGSETRVIDLKGNTRFIREVVLTYKSRPSFKGRAIVDLYGQH